MSEKIGPMFKWFGSKWQSARKYPVPVHDFVWEPYAGGAGYSLRHWQKSVFIYDDNQLLLELWPWLIAEANTQDILDIPVGAPIGTDIRSMGLSRGQSLLLKCWQRTNSVGDCWTISKWGHLPGQWTENTRARLAEQVHAVKHWCFGDTPNVFTSTVFCDPPYLYNYRYGRGSDFDHAALARRLRAYADGGAQVIVCEATCQKTGAIPDWLPFTESHRSVTSRRKLSQSHHSRELVWLS